MISQIYQTNLSSSLEYIMIYDEDECFYHSYFKFKEINSLFQYFIDKEIWNKELLPLILENEGLNIGKHIWGYILNHKIKETVKYQHIIKQLRK